MDRTIPNYLNHGFLENLEKEEKKYLQLSNEIVGDIKNNKLSILDLIQNLKCLLVSNGYNKREMGVLILCEVIKDLDTKVMNGEHIDVLCSYLAEKLKDHHQVATSALKGLLPLVSYPDTSSKAIIQLLTNLFNHIVCQQQQQPDRYIIYQIYEAVLTHHGHVVDTMNNDFVYGIIGSVDGERDPKNLIYLFKWMPVFLRRVNLAHLTEEMFDILACYFPVDFKAPSHDTNRITREDLAEGLCQCLTCIPDFGQHAIPLALEKLDSALKIAKEDSLDILKRGCQNYSSKTYKQFSLEILNELQKHIFTVEDVDLKEKCKTTLIAVIRNLESGDRDHTLKLITDITCSLKPSLVPDLKIFGRTIEYLLTLAKSTPSASLLVVRLIGSFLRHSYEASPSHSVLFTAYIDIIRTAIENNPKEALRDDEEIRQAPRLCLEALNGGEGLKGFAEIAGYVPGDIRKILFKQMEEAILDQGEPRKGALLRCLRKMGECYPEEISYSVLDNTKVRSGTELSAYIECVSQSLVNVAHFEDYLINTFTNYAVSDADSSKIIFKHLHYFLRENPSFLDKFTQREFLPKLTDFLSKIDVADTNWLLDIKAVLTMILRNQNHDTQKQIYDSESRKTYANRSVLLSVLSGIILGLKRTVRYDYEDKIDFLLNAVVNKSDSFTKNASLETLASILNKLDQDLLDGYLDKVHRCCNSMVSTSDKIALLSWVTKSLVIRNHSAAWKWTDALFDMLNEDTDCSQGFRLVIRDENNPLSIENDSNFMPLYKQKFFVYVTNKLSEIKDVEKASYFNTMGYLIENAPKQGVLGQFKKITRLLFLCLEKSSQPEILEIILLKLTECIADRESAIENCLEDILLRILDLTTFESSMRVRIAAIKGLKEVAKRYPIYKLVPLQQRVIRKLGVCIDDKKRIVRQDAAQCRSLWYLLDSDV